ncbi:MAG: Trm112 family protein [Nitrososphaerota archaeon]
MKYRLMDILACPMCRNFPLKLHVFQSESRYSVEEATRCELYCSYHDGLIDELEETRCRECYSVEITDGLLTCPKCGRWYAIIDEIPIMLPDNLRDRKRESEFINKWSGKIPPDVLKMVSRE